jgi:hypothetical protein
MEGYPYALSIDKHQARIRSISKLLKYIFPDGILPLPGSRRLSPSQPTLNVPASDQLTLSSFLDFLGNYPFSDLDNGLSSVATFISYLLEINPSRFKLNSPITAYVLTKDRAAYENGTNSASTAFGSLWSDNLGQLSRRNGLLIPTDSRMLRTRFRNRDSVLGWNSLSQFKVNPHGGAGQDRDKLYANPTNLSIQIHLIDFVHLSSLLTKFLSLEEIHSTRIYSDVSSWLSNSRELAAQSPADFNTLDLPYILGPDGRQSIVYPLLCIKFPSLFDVVLV